MPSGQRERGRGKTNFTYCQRYEITVEVRLLLVFWARLIRFDWIGQQQPIKVHMHRYEVQKCLGDGTYGSVHKAKNRQTNEVVAIKTMKRKYSSWEECINLREIKSLRKLSHPNIIKLREVVCLFDKQAFFFLEITAIYPLTSERTAPRLLEVNWILFSSLKRERQAFIRAEFFFFGGGGRGKFQVIRENGSLHLVFEHMDCNLYQRIKDRTSFLPEAKVRNIIYQVLLVRWFTYQRKREDKRKSVRPPNGDLNSHFQHCWRTEPCLSSQEWVFP